MLRADARTDARMDNVKTVYPPQTKFAGGIIMSKLKYKAGLLMTINMVQIASRAGCKIL